MSDYWDEPTHAAVERDARQDWLRERPDPKTDSDDELPDFLGSPAVCDPATCRHYIRCAPDPWATTETRSA